MSDLDKYVVSGTRIYKDRLLMTQGEMLRDLNGRCNMLEALKGLVDQMKRADRVYNRGECDSIEYEDAIEAIAKAEGVS